MNNILIVLDEWTSNDLSVWTSAIQVYKYDRAYLLFLIYPPFMDEVKDIVTVTKPKIVAMADGLNIPREDVIIDIELSNSFIFLRGLVKDKQIKNILIEGYPDNPLNRTRINLLLSGACQINVI